MRIFARRTLREFRERHPDAEQQLRAWYEHTRRATWETPADVKADYEAALEEIDLLWGAEYGSLEGDKLDVLATLVEAFEEERYPILPPDPIEAIYHQMERQGLSRKDLEPYIGSRARVSEVLNRKRPLSLTMIRNLQNGLDISAEVLIQPYELQKT